MYIHTIRPLQKIGLLFLCSTMLVILHTRAAAAPLYTELTRLHVIANSDTAEDQSLKLEVRDRILAVTAQLTENAEDASVVRAILRENLDVIQIAAQETVYANGFPYPVAVALEDGCFFDRREYDGFALPAGMYPALRVKIGQAQGQNWWCVIFPPLCTAASMTELETAAVSAGLQESQIKLMTAEGETVEVRFWILDLLANWF